MASSDLNSVILVGRLTRDAELSFLPNGNAVCKMGIAVNRSRKDGDQWVNEANFFDVTLFGKSGESLKQYLTKGKQIAVQGSLKQDRWEKDGQKFSKVQIVASNVHLLGGRSDGGYSGASQSSGNYQQQTSFTPKQPVQEDSFETSSSDFPEDIPF